MKAGDTVLLAKLGEASYQAFSVFKNTKTKSQFVSEDGNCVGTIDKKPRPWYPYGKEVVLLASPDGGTYWVVQDKEGKIWPNPVPFWAMTVLEPSDKREIYENPASQRPSS